MSRKEDTQEEQLFIPLAILGIIYGSFSEQKPKTFTQLPRSS